MTITGPDGRAGAPDQAVVDAAMLVLDRMGLTPADLLSAPAARPAAPTFAEYVPVVSALVTDGCRRAYGSYWNRVTEQWGSRGIDEPTPGEIRQLVKYVRANVVPRRNSRGGRSAAEHLIGALRCLYKHAEDNGLINPADNPARKVDKPRRLPSTRHAVADKRLAEINQAAAATGDDPDLDTLLLRLHTETACRRGGALALRPQDLDPEQCLIQLREKGETVRWQPVSPHRDPGTPRSARPDARSAPATRRPTPRPATTCPPADSTTANPTPSGPDHRRSTHPVVGYVSTCARLLLAPGWHTHEVTLDNLPSADGGPRPCGSSGSSPHAGDDGVMVADAAVESYCRHLLDNRDFSRAYRIAESIRVTRSAVLGPESPATVTAGDLLGETLFRLGKTAELRQLAEEMLELCRRCRGDDDPAAMQWQKILADALRRVSEVRSSIELAEDLLDRCRRLFGERHETTLGIAASLVVAMIEDCDYEAARAVAEDLWEWRTQAQGPDHEDTLRAAYTLVFVTSLGLAGFRERQHAGRLALDTLARSERRCGYFHPHTAEVKRLITRMRGFAGTYDPIGMAYARVPGNDLSEAASDCARFSVFSFIRASGIELASLEIPASAAAVFRDANERIVEQLRRLAAGNDPLTILRCARRVPRDWIGKFLEQVGPSSDGDALEKINVEFPLLAANIALGVPAHADGRPPRTTDTLLDGVRMALLCALHRSHAYYLNSAVRWEAFGSAMEPEPIESYVRRSQRARNVTADVLAYAQAGGSAGITGLTTRRLFGRTAIRMTASEELGEHHLTLDNYLPITISPERSRQWTGYLSHPRAAPQLGGLPFEQWWRCWLALNAVAKSWVGDYLPPASSDAAGPAERERLRLCAEAQNTGMIEVDRNRLRDAVLHDRIRDHPSQDEYDAFVASLTWQPGMQEPELIESPAIFYPSGETTMFWDLLRHGGVLPGLARRLSRTRGPIGKHAGKYFENRVHAALSKHPAVTYLRSDVLLPNEAGDQDGIQIDHGFVLQDLLVLVESKSFVKTRGYLVAHDEGFKIRARRPIQGVLPERDRKLRELRDQIALAWGPAAPRQALYVICTMEVEYVPSDDPEFWLDRSRDIPRVCTLSELLEWLDDLDPATMAAHPGCIPLTCVPGNT